MIFLNFFFRVFIKNFRKKSLQSGNIYVIVLSSTLLFHLCNFAEFSVIILICGSAKPLLTLSVLIAQRQKDLTDYVQAPFANSIAPFILFPLPSHLKIM